MKVLKKDVEDSIKALGIVCDDLISDLMSSIECCYSANGECEYLITPSWLKTNHAGLRIRIELTDDMFCEPLYPAPGEWYSIEHRDHAVIGAFDDVVYRDEAGRLILTRNGAVEFAVIHDVPF